MKISIRRHFSGGAPDVDVACYWQISVRWKWRGWNYERCFYPFKARFTERERNEYTAEARYMLAVIPTAKTIEELNQMCSLCKYH